MMNAQLGYTSRLVLGFCVKAAVIGVVFGSFTSCSPESPKKKAFEQAEKVKTSENAVFNPKVDILFVVDDSISMDAEQKNLSRNIELFTSEIEKSKMLDYHIGVITTSFYDYGSSCITSFLKVCGDGVLNGGPSGTPYVTKSTPNGLAILAQNIMVGTNGSTTEKMFEPVRAALTDPIVNKQNAGFYRPDASIVVIFVTDTEDQSKTLDAKTYTQFMLGLKQGDARKALTYGVYIRNDSEKTDECSRDDKDRGRITEAIALGGGTSFSLCDPNFGTKLGELAGDLAQKVSKNLYLNRRPDVSTITVNYGSQVIENDLLTGWSYDASINAIVFGNDLQLSAQPEGTQMEVNYKAARSQLN